MDEFNLDTLLQSNDAIAEETVPKVLFIAESHKHHSCSCELSIWHRIYINSGTSIKHSLELIHAGVFGLIWRETDSPMMVQQFLFHSNLDSTKHHSMTRCPPLSKIDY